MTLSLKRFSFQAMSAYCEIQTYDESRINAKKITQELAIEIARIEQKYSSGRKDNFLFEVNQSAGNRLGIKLDSETRALFDFAQQSYEQSDGVFDITATKLSNIWKSQGESEPSQKELDALLPNIGFDKLQRRKSRLYLPNGMEIDFGPIIKEYATDHIAKLAKTLGTDHGLVNLGGDFSVIGPQPDNQPWVIGVANPTDKDALLAKIEVLEGGIASCGDFSKYLSIEGKDYNSLVSAKSGWPCIGLRAATVASHLCTHSGSLARTALSLGEEEGLQRLREEGVKFASIGHNGKIPGADLQII